MRPEKRIERRRNIVRAAREVFLKFGYRKTALEDVARSAAIGKATLYHYFEGKDDLFSAVVAEIYEEYLSNQRTVISRETAAADKLRRYARQLIAEHRKLLGSAHGFGRLEKDFPMRVISNLRRQRQSELAILQEILAGGVQSGEFRSINTERVALLLFGSLRAMVMDIKTQTEDGDSVVSEFLEILFCGLLVNTDGKELS